MATTIYDIAKAVGVATGFFLLKILLNYKDSKKLLPIFDQQQKPARLPPLADDFFSRYIVTAPEHIIELSIEQPRPDTIRIELPTTLDGAHDAFLSLDADRSEVDFTRPEARKAIDWYVNYQQARLGRP